MLASARIPKPLLLSISQHAPCALLAYLVCCLRSPPTATKEFETGDYIRVGRRITVVAQSSSSGVVQLQDAWFPAAGATGDAASGKGLTISKRDTSKAMALAQRALSCTTNAKVKVKTTVALQIVLPIVEGRNSHSLDLHLGALARHSQAEAYYIQGRCHHARSKYMDAHVAYTNAIGKVGFACFCMQ